MPVHPLFAADCLARVSLLATDAGGRQSAAASSYRPHHNLRDDYLSSGIHQYLETEWLKPGETSLANIQFGKPAHYPHCLWRGRVLRVQEGGRLVGYAEVIDIFNPLLDRETRASE